MNFKVIWLLLGLCCLPLEVFAVKDESKDIVSSSIKAEGFFNLFYHQASGDLYLEVDKLEQDFLMLTSLLQGLGSNDIGLDRGQLGETRLVRFERYGPFVILKQLNTKFVAQTENLAEQQAATTAFAH